MIGPEAAFLAGQLEGGALGAGAFLAGGAAAAHLDGRQGADTLGAIVEGAVGDGALNAVVGVHIVVHGAFLLLNG